MNLQRQQWCAALLVGLLLGLGLTHQVVQRLDVTYALSAAIVSFWRG